MIENDIEERNLNSPDDIDLNKHEFIDKFDSWKEVGEYIFKNHFANQNFIKQLPTGLTQAIDKHDIAKLAHCIDYGKLANEFVSDYYCRKEVRIDNKIFIELYSHCESDGFEE